MSVVTLYIYSGFEQFSNLTLSYLKNYFKVGPCLKPNPHLDATSAVTQDVAGAVPRVLNVHRGILRGIGTLVILDTLAPDTREKTKKLR